jgi:alcohol dehydrogenase (NADP+)
LTNGCLMGATHLGSRKEMIRMLQLAADKGLKSWVEQIPISEKGLAEAGKPSFPRCLLIPLLLLQDR